MISKIAKARTAVRIAQALITEIERSDQVVELLQEALQAEFQQWDLYYAYKAELQGLEREPIADHFAEHAEEEAQHIDILQRYLITMGVQPTKDRRKIPILDNPSIEEIISLQYKFEMDAVRKYQEILRNLEDLDPLRIEIEDILATEMEHAQDLQLLFKR